MSSIAAINQERVGRVGHNQRNFSNEIFNFEGSSPKGTYTWMMIDNNCFKKIDAADAERNRMHVERQKRLERDDFRRYNHDIKVRNWKSEIERSRWQKMAAEYDTKQECLTAKQLRARIGKNSVSYNPITLEYHKNPSGQALAQEDAKATLRTSIRSLNLYLKNNSFDPMRCQDIPKDVSAVFGVPDTTKKGPKDGAVKSLTPPKYGRRSHPPVRPNLDVAVLDVPKNLLNQTGSSVDLLKNRGGSSVSEILSFLRHDKEKWLRHY